jgi:hypothetical protein
MTHADGADDEQDGEKPKDRYSTQWQSRPSGYRHAKVPEMLAFGKGNWLSWFVRLSPREPLPKTYFLHFFL